MIEQEPHQATHLWLVRHAPVAPGKIFGHTDVPADFSDHDQISRLADLLPEDSMFFSSDLRRSTETAMRLLDISGRSNRDFQCRTELREQNFGNWENRSYDEIERSDPDAYFDFWRDPASNCPPAGESFAQLQGRVEAEINSSLVDRKSPDLVFVIHAGPIRALLGMALGLAPSASLAFQIDPLSLTRLTLYQGTGEETWQIGCVNMRP